MQHLVFVPLHSSRGNKVRPCPKQEKKNQKTECLHVLIWKDIYDIRSGKKQAAEHQVAYDDANVVKQPNFTYVHLQIPVYTRKDLKTYRIIRSYNQFGSASFSPNEMYLSQMTFIIFTIRKRFSWCLLPSNSRAQWFGTCAVQSGKGASNHVDRLLAKSSWTSYYIFQYFCCFLICKTVPIS